LLSLSPDAGDKTSLSILCLGAHSDDIEIGCGGSVLNLLGRYPGATVTWMVLGASGPRIDEARASAAAFTQQARSCDVTVMDFRDGFFPAKFAEIKEAFERLKTQVEPDLIFTHMRADRHQDHRIVSDLTWNTFRRHLILEYEIPKYDGDLGQPNLYVPLSRAEADAKVDLLMTHFGTQRQRSWFTPDTFWALLRLRGIEAASPSGFAEAHFAHKVIV
jgi:LmbE family N-acetylglucosaminyl deacetylase